MSADHFEVVVDTIPDLIDNDEDSQSLQTKETRPKAAVNSPLSNIPGSVKQSDIYNCDEMMSMGNASSMSGRKIFIGRVGGKGWLEDPIASDWLERALDDTVLQTSEQDALRKVDVKL